MILGGRDRQSEHNELARIRARLHTAPLDRALLALPEQVDAPPRKH